MRMTDGISLALRCELHFNNSNFNKGNHMSLIRYQTPNSVMLPSLDRWASLRHDSTISWTCLSGPASVARRNSFPVGRPALDLYQTNDNIVAVVELPGMRKEDIEISLMEGTLSISGERKEEQAKEGAARTERFIGKFRRSVTSANPRRRQQSHRHLQGWHSDRDAAEGGGSEAETDPNQRQLSNSQERRNT